MSKTETQSDAQKLSALLNVAMAFDHGRIGTDRRFVEMDATVVASVDAELRRLDAENKALREAWRVLEEDLEYVGGGEYALLVSERQKFREVLERIDSQAAAKTGDAA
ncbi:hypothetical protein [Delftia lacustris]|uniref:Uncharacterized protein n=1 Tax=Delftia lacustris TaxID=558537 RepID=A0A1H3TUL7_9BURK|nr:hypothetical protein [Delftia lacustris]SDZ53405.1 hypothetical protein SAMN05421547_13251 [Delftia lacustris]